MRIERIMGGFTLLEHTADVGVSSYGESLEEALAWLATGMFSLIVDPSTTNVQGSQVLSVASRDLESLAVDWLNELLFQYETTGFLPKDYQISLRQAKDGISLEALCQGDQLDPARHGILIVVKAATYHNLSVEQGPPWRISVILDI